ncbi:MAG: hypothetical protein JW863_01615 [Chitinispirillaceae bacterium]|nr:hypothetical protein [Chitinispirillaceae bacterium]
MMVRMIKLFCLTALLSIVACGVSEKALTSAEKKVDELKAAGVPDSTLSTVKVYLYQAKDAQQRGNTGVAKTAAKNMKRELAAVEATYKENLTRLMPVIDSLRSVIRASRTGLTGMQLKKMDSMMVAVDSFANMKWYLQAYTKAQEIATAIPQFNKDEERAKEVAREVVGKWVCTNVTKSKEVKGVHAIEKKIFTFIPDGQVTLVENKKGQSGPFLKEDWEFRSWGKWGCHGDTIHLFINRFASIRQNFERLYVEKEGNRITKKTWKKEPAETYDSLITDGSQDRYITFDDLKGDFVRSR